MSAASKDAASSPCISGDDGIAWDSARSNLPCPALLERAADGLACPPFRTRSFPLTQPHVRDELLTLVRDFRLTLAP